MLAKIASNVNKPNGQFSLPFHSEQIEAYMADLNVRKIPGIGKVGGASESSSTGVYPIVD